MPTHVSRSPRSGSATVVVLCLVTALGVLVLSLLTSAVSNTEWTTGEVDRHRAETAAESVTLLVAEDLWSGFENWLGGRVPRAWDFREYVEEQGVLADAEGAVAVDFRDRLGLPLDPDGVPLMDDVRLEEVSVRRVDELDTTYLVVRAVAAARRGGESHGRDMRASVEQAFAVQPPDWEGLDFALLANNINCIMCHTSVDSAQRVYNENEALYGTYDRVKIASLEGFHLRADPDSSVAGTLYLGGHGLTGDGHEIDNWGSLSMRSAQFDELGKLAQDSWGDLSPEPLSPAHALSPSALENLYLDYGAGGEESLVDGYLPDSFPSPFPDDGGYDFETGTTNEGDAGNRRVDRNEFLATVHGSSGTITGGKASVLAKGDSIVTPHDYAAFRDGSDRALSGITEGHVFLQGTKDDPIVLNGDVAIDGDLILTGYVKGEGSLKVSGNVYMPADVVYLDGTTAGGARTFGQGPDGGSNALAIASGGNVMIGDFYHPEFGQGNPANGFAHGSWGFTLDEISIFNRGEWMKTQPTLPGEPQQVRTGTKAWTEKIALQEQVEYEQTVKTYEWVPTGNQVKQPVYQWVWEDNGKPEPYFERVKVKQLTGYKWVDEKVKVQTGTKKVTRTKWVDTGEYQYVEHEEPILEMVSPQVPNPLYEGPGYLPRYYSMKEGAHVPIFNKEGYFDPRSESWIGEERPGSWNGSHLTIAQQTNKNNDILYDEAGNPKAVVSSLTPTGGWMDDKDLRDLILDLLGSRDASTPVEIDATIYSNNSIFGILPLTGSVGSNGQLLVNGAIVAADVGLLAPRGTQLNYDPRGRELLNIRSEDRLVMRRALWAPAVH